jgi:hypothetical protein
MPRASLIGINSMPVYYFHLQSGDCVTEDPDGTELPDLQMARQYAVFAAKELLAHIAATLTPSPRMSSPSIRMSPRLIPIRNSIRRSCGTSSAYASAFNANTEVRDRFWMKRYGPSRGRT